MLSERKGVEERLDGSNEERRTMAWRVEVDKQLRSMSRAI